MVAAIYGTHFFNACHPLHWKCDEEGKTNGIDEGSKGDVEYLFAELYTGEECAVASSLFIRLLLID